MSHFQTTSDRQTEVGNMLQRIEATGKGDISYGNSIANNTLEEKNEKEKNQKGRERKKESDLSLVM